MAYLELEMKVKSWFKNLDPQYKRAFWIAFGLINLAFVFHSINFMFGDHDWTNLRGETPWNAASFEGRPTHFMLQAILFDGQILPLLTNILSFAALALSGVLLAYYWRLPLNTFNYVVFAVFVGTLPYTLVWLYYAKDTLANLSLPLFCVGGLLASDFADRSKKPLYHLVAIALFFYAFSCYAAIINMIGVCLLGSMMLSYSDKETSLLKIVQAKVFTVVDILIALLSFKLMLEVMRLGADNYNTQTIDLAYLPEKLADTCRAMIMQFVVELPFMELKYKILLLVMFLSGVTALIWKSGLEKLLPQILGITAVLFASKFAYFIADERGQILAQMENFAYVPRLDFYGLVYVYALGVAGLLMLPAGKIRKLGVIFIVAVIFMSFVRDMHAQKVWKLGFDAEMKTHERIVSRIEQHPDFRPGVKYRLLQVGSLSLRSNFYYQREEEEISLDLLSTSFTPEFMSRIVYNFYYPQDLFYNNASVRELSPAGIEFLQKYARPWPSLQSIYIDGDIIIVVLTDEGISKMFSKLR